MDVVVYDEEDRRYVPLTAVLVLTLVVAVLAAGLALLLGTGAQAGTDAAAPPSRVSAPQAGEADGDEEGDGAAGAGGGEACSVLAERADVALERSRRLVAALEAHTRVMDELLAGRLTAQQALDRDLPTLTEGASDRTQFAEELAAYERARDACRG